MGTRNTKVGTPRFNNHDNSKTQISELRRVKSAIFQLANIIGGGAPSPTGLATLAEQVNQSSILNTIVSKLSQSQDMEINLVKDTITDIIYSQVRQYDEDTATWSVTYQDVTGATVGTPPNPIEYLDPSTVLTLMLTELQTIVTNTNTNATEAKQDSIITELQNILNEPDHEITSCVGFDSGTLLPESLSNLDVDSLGIGGGTAPAYSNVTASSFDVTLANANYAMSFDVDGNYGTVDFVNIFIKVEQAALNPGVEGLTFVLVNDGAPFPGTNLDSGATGTFAPGESKIIHLSYDNRLNQFNNFDIHFVAPWPGSGFPQAYNVSLLGTTFAAFNPADVITEYVKWEDNIEVSTEYKDFLGDPYTLSGFFIKDNNKATEERLSFYLSNIQSSNEVLVSNTTKSDLERLKTEADDLVQTISYLDSGDSVNRRVDTIVYSSAALALTVTETFAYAGGAGDYYVTSITLS
jgi:hypothetical protein